MSKFFIDRPIFAGVISILFVLFGALAFLVMPRAQFPEITPPVVVVETTLPGASAEVVAETIASPIEQEVNGVDDMLYMRSISASDGSYKLEVTFDLGTDVDIATVLVQNRVAQAEARLPEGARRQGVKTRKQTENILAFVSFYSPNGTYGELFLSNLITINVKDELLRINGIGQVTVFPSQEYGMRVWLDPDRLKARGLTTGDVVDALAEQNVQVASGQIGQPPMQTPGSFQYTVQTLGRLKDVTQFEDVIIKTDPDGGVLRIKDVARVELGAKQYNDTGLRNGEPAGLLLAYATPGGNVINAVRDMRQRLEDLRSIMPPDVEFEVIWDAATFVEVSLQQVYTTLIEAFVLVLIVILAFLHSWRMTLIPMLAIPVSIVGTFAFMLALGFSVNMLTMFGLVLAIGIVVDDAIIVVENVERLMADDKLGPRAASIKAMQQITGAIIATTLVSVAVFVPAAMLPGVTGQLYRQFAITIAVSVVISSVCALTLSPALCSVFVRPPTGQKGWFGRSFDRLFDAFNAGYRRIVDWSVRHLWVSGAVCAGLLAATVYSVTTVPTGFLPQEDEGIVLIDWRLPDNASFDRNLAVYEKADAMILDTPGVKSTAAFPGFAIVFGKGLNKGSTAVALEPWDERTDPETQLDAILEALRQKLDTIQEAEFILYTRPAIPGLGNRGGFDMQLLDRGNLGAEAWGVVANQVVEAANAQSKLGPTFTTFSPGVAEIYLDIDREKVKKLDIPLQKVFDTLEAFLGSTYINDFNLFGRTWQVRVQSDSQFRAQPEDIARLEVRNAKGDTVPLGSLLTISQRIGPDRVERYNLFRTASVQGEPARGASSGQALAIMEGLGETELPQGAGFGWLGMAFQEKAAGGAGLIAFTLAIVVVYLILCAQYESWNLPISVVFTVPVFVLFAMIALMLRAFDNGIYSQVGLVLLISLGAKNAILIVEFARAQRDAGLSVVDAAVEAARLRLRPIMMTSIAFIAGVTPLAVASGAGAASRQAVGTAVMGGMLGGVFLGVFVTPVMYAIFQTLSELVSRPKPAAEEPAPTAGDD